MVLTPPSVSSSPPSDWDASKPAASALRETAPLHPPTSGSDLRRPVVGEEDEDEEDEEEEGSVWIDGPPGRLRIRGRGEGPRALATAASFPCRLSLWSRLPVAPAGEAEEEVNQEREEISLRLLCCLSS